MVNKSDGYKIKSVRKMKSEPLRMNFLESKLSQRMACSALIVFPAKKGRDSF